MGAVAKLASVGRTQPADGRPRAARSTGSYGRPQLHDAGELQLHDAERFCLFLAATDDARYDRAGSRMAVRVALACDFDL
jgi:hypothetical protein